MFERLTARVERAAEERARAAARAIAGRARDALPGGIAAAAEGAGERLTAKALRRRLALDPALRSIWARLR
jgi:hypothetical protein